MKKAAKHFFVGFLHFFCAALFFFAPGPGGEKLGFIGEEGFGFIGGVEILGQALGPPGPLGFVVGTKGYGSLGGLSFGGRGLVFFQMFFFGNP